MSEQEDMAEARAFSQFLSKGVRQVLQHEAFIVLTSSDEDLAQVERWARSGMSVTLFEGTFYISPPHIRM